MPGGNWVLKKLEAMSKLEVVMHSYNPSLQEALAGSESKFEAS